MAVHIVFWKTTTYHPINVGCGVQNRYKNFSSGRLDLIIDIERIENEYIRASETGC